jgi:hypothetical protein
VQDDAGTALLMRAGNADAIAHARIERQIIVDADAAVDGRGLESSVDRFGQARSGCRH